MTLTLVDKETPPSTCPKLEQLDLKREAVQKAKTRATKSRDALDGYLATMSVEHVEPAALKDVVTHYEATGAEIDKKILVLNEELAQLDANIKSEEEALRKPSEDNDALRNRASVGVVAEEASEVQLVLIYGVHHSMSFH